MQWECITGVQGSYQLAPCIIANGKQTTQKDECAIAIYADKELRPNSRVGYFRSEDAAVLYKLFRDRLVEGQCFVKAKQPISKFSHRKGPMQNISFGFKTNDCNVDMVRSLADKYEKLFF